MYIIQARAHILIPKFPRVTTISWLPRKCQVRSASLCEVPQSQFSASAFMSALAVSALRKQVFGSSKDLAKSLFASERGDSLFQLSAGKFWEHLEMHSFYKVVLQVQV